MAIRIFKPLLAVGLAVGIGAGVAACMQDAPARQTAALQPQTIPGFGLFYMDEGGSAKLAYGQANSDNVGLMLQCTKGSRRVDVTDAARAAPAPTLTLASGGARSVLKTSVEDGDGGSLLVAHTPASEAPLQAFRRSGRIEVSYAGQSYAVAASPDERVGVETFFEACDGRARA